MHRPMICALVVFAFAGCSTGGGADVALELGTGPSDAAVVAEHNITLSALEAGESDFWARGDDGVTRQLRFTDTQRATLLDGTAVISRTVDEGEGDRWVRMSVTEASEETGW